jgi:hypothetical protein
MPRSIVWRLSLVAPLLALLTALLPPTAQAQELTFNAAPFQAQWQRYDLPVQQGQANRSWTWGPNSPGDNAVTSEPYADSPGGRRVVQYFDKARMEINDPATSAVTNGLLVRELVAGQIALGDTAAQPADPAEQAVAGDPVAVNPDAPTYASFRGVASLNNDHRAPDRTDQRVDQSIDQSGAVGSQVGGEAHYAYYDPNLGHNIADVFWEFITQTGTIYRDGQLVADQPVFDPWWQPMGLPITEPYWTTARVGGVDKAVLVQLFERRVLTYTPSNPAAFQVEMGNVGQHYFAWRYANPQAPYLDNRSDAVAVLRSYYNAINRQEYARAYGYWQDTSQLPPFDQFQQGYANTASVQLITGTVGGDVGAGQLYFSVPVTLTALTKDNAVQTFVGCYTLHIGQPQIQAAPPFQPLGITAASIRQVPNDADTAALMAQACQMGHQPAPELGEINGTSYLDDRSDAVAVLRSHYSAINRQEYARAYSYWQATDQLQPFEQFRQGYAETKSVQLTTGDVRTGAAAGNLYYSVPVTLKATTTAGATQTFVGCYTLHLAQPQLQATPPYQPIGITDADIQQVPNDADTAARMAEACQ